MERMKIDPKKTLEDAKDKGGEILESAKGTVSNVVKNVSSQVSGRIEAAKDMIEEFREKDMDEVMDDLGGFVRSYPIPVLLGCIFLGYGLGRLFGRKS